MNKSIKVDKLSKKNKVAHQTPLVKVDLEELSRVEPLEDPPQLEMNEIKKLKSKYWKKCLFKWETSLFLLLLLEVILVGVINPQFFNPRVILGSINDFMPICIISLGVTFVLITGGMIPNQLIVFTLLALLAYGLLHRTAYGRKVFLCGVNKRAADYCGIRTKWITLSTYILSGMSASLAGLLLVTSLVGCMQSGSAGSTNQGGSSSDITVVFIPKLTGNAFFESSDVSCDACTIMVSQGTPEQLGQMLINMGGDSLTERGKDPTKDAINYVWHYSQATVAAQNMRLTKEDVTITVFAFTNSIKDYCQSVQSLPSIM
ncbi:MAG: hypothetical protein RR090_04225 [Niameybacter sp.]|uniref:ABC transporter permease subunit n=1 Tax=Niameybacter sp. TaxID=2033640 RepID=UPI002FCA3E0D